ncbi:hypothetical protein [Idiomarina loihiensis]|uniref:hypothetical protein n=1 Tax=Idiomarina loihiensis TaxID=135577 RepID=UPI0038515871
MLKTETITIQLDKIKGIHRAVKDIASVLADSQFSANAAGFSDAALKDILLLHPLFLVKFRNQFYVAAGFRAFQIAKLKLPATATITCQLTSASSDELVNLAKTDILASSIIYSLSTKVAEQTKNLVATVGSDSAKDIHKKFASDRGLAQLHKRTSSGK